MGSRPMHELELGKVCSNVFCTVDCVIQVCSVFCIPRIKCLSPFLAIALLIKFVWYS